MTNEMRAAIAYARTIKDALEALRGDGALLHQAGLWSGSLYNQITDILMDRVDDPDKALTRLQRTSAAAARWMAWLVKGN